MIVKERGTVIRLLEEVSGTSKAGNAYTVREFVIEVNDEGYRDNVHFKAMGQRVQDLASVREGDEVEVTYKPMSREHNGRWYDENRLFGVRSLRQPEPPKAEEDASNDLPF